MTELVALFGFFILFCTISIFSQCSVLSVLRVLFFFFYVEVIAYISSITMVKTSKFPWTQVLPHAYLGAGFCFKRSIHNLKTVRMQ